jgi:uncharacterized protein (TIGR03084 family)
MKQPNLARDLAAEHSALAAILSELTPAEWALPTPSVGWTVADQISHLCFFDERATMALVDPDAFLADRERIIAMAPQDPSVDAGRTRPSADLFSEWCKHSEQLRARAMGVDSGRRVPWYGPSMTVPSFLTARLMETWAHGHDVCVATDRPAIISDRLRHVAHIGYAARPFSLLINRLPADDRPVRLELTGPDGQTWSWGPPEVDDRVTGDAYDFCLVVTQRRDPNDSHLEVVGEAARQWIDVAQAFAGGPGRG